MIYTVTFNPSLDYIVSVNNFQLGMTNRTATEMMLPGGKGGRDRSDREIHSGGRRDFPDQPEVAEH